MTSSDNEILVRIYEWQDRILLRLDSLESGQRVIVQRLDGVEAEQSAIMTELKGQREELTAIRTEQQAQSKELSAHREALSIIGTEQRVLTQKVDDMQTSVYWGFALLGLFIAVVSWLRPREPKPEPRRELTVSELDELVRLLEPRLRTKTE